MQQPNWNDLRRISSLRPVSGVVYVLSNPSFEDNRFKIGLTKLAAYRRAKQLFTTGVPTPFDIRHQWQTSHTKLMESFMHMVFELLRVNAGREFFDAPFPLIIEVGDLIQQIVLQF